MNAIRRAAAATTTRCKPLRASLVDWLALLMLLAGSVVWPH